MADHDPSDPHAHHHEVIVSANSLTAPRGVHTVDTLPTPAELEEMRRVVEGAAGASQASFELAVWTVAGEVPRLIAAVEALTAENAMLRADALEAELTGGKIKRLGRDLTEARSTIERLQAEVERLKDLCEVYDDDLHDAQKAIGNAAGSLMWCERRLPAGYSPAVRRLVKEMGFNPADFERPGATPSLTDHGWYSTMRREVEAAHADAKEGAQ